MRESPYALDERAARAAGAVRRGEELRLPCPIHDSSPETLALREGRVGPLWHCHAGCASRDVRDALLAAGILVRRHPLPRSTKPRPSADRSPPRWLPGAWSRAVPVVGTPADAYLRSRGLLPPWPAALRWDGERRRLLARASLGAKLRALHATVLPERQRRTYGPVRGAAVRLAPMRGGVLALAEGIETALAYAALTGTPTWAALSAAGMKHAELPEGLKWLAVAADFDGPGLLAAEQLEHRACEAGIAVRIDLPWHHGADWADVLASSARPRLEATRAPVSSHNIRFRRDHQALVS